MGTQIVGIENMSREDVLAAVNDGAKFVIYYYCVSVIILTFKRSSNIYFVRPGESRVGKGASYTLISLICGWWGFPWGPIHTVGSLATNLGGGRDVTGEILARNA